MATGAGAARLGMVNRRSLCSLAGTVDSHTVNRAIDESYMDIDQVQDGQHRLIAALAAKFERRGVQVRVFETHLSCVLLAGEDAYKFKKPVHLRFVDFSTLEKRKFYCDEEFRRNRRLAPELYVGVVAVTGSADNPGIEAPGSPTAMPIEYAVQMRTFRQEALWRYRLAAGILSSGEADNLAERLSAFHLGTPIAPETHAWGSADLLADSLAEDLADLLELAGDASARSRLDQLNVALAALGGSLAAIFDARRSAGMIRECHGDLHCGNIVTLESGVTAFDCIEFNESMYWIDVMNDIAFLCMDLEYAGRRGLAVRFLSGYVEKTGDYGGLCLLRYYKCRRALVRCKVAWLRARQQADKGEDASAMLAEGHRYLVLSERIMEWGHPALIIMHGLSGSGKSTFAARGAEELGAIWLRSDVMRKRMHGFAPMHRPDGKEAELLYRDAASDRVYENLLDTAEAILRSGCPVVVDATFLKRRQRDAFKDLAKDMDVPFVIMHTHAPEAVLQERVSLREKEGDDVSDAGTLVLSQQSGKVEPLAADELGSCIDIDTTAGIDDAMVKEKCDAIPHRS